MLYLDKALDPSIWTMLPVVEMKLTSLIVLQLLCTTVTTVRMLLSDAISHVSQQRDTVSYQVLTCVVVYTAICVENEIRLVGGTKESQGRVEICRTEAWNTICDGLWSNEEGAVICKELGYSRHSKLPHPESMHAVYSYMSIRFLNLINALSMQTQLLLLVPALARALDQSTAPILSAMERRLASLTAPTQWTLLVVLMPGMLEYTALKHVSIQLSLINC